MRFWVLALFLSGGLVAWHIFPFPTQAELAIGDPKQVMVAPGEVKDCTRGAAIFHALARYAITARILSREPYYFDHDSDVSSLDLALGWNRMSDPRVYDQLNVSQGGRWYNYHWYNGPPIPPAEIICSSANNHIIAANFGISEKLFWLREGDVVSLTGYLVQVTKPVDGSVWTSSLSRTDSGDHSCEVFWVDSVKADGR